MMQISTKEKSPSREHRCLKKKQKKFTRERRSIGSHKVGMAVVERGRGRKPRQKDRQERGTFARSELEFQTELEEEERRAEVFSPPFDAWLIHQWSDCRSVPPRPTTSNKMGWGAGMDKDR
jgi:hypothetical protein